MKVERFGRSEASERAERQAPQSAPRPCAIGYRLLDVRWPVGCLRPRFARVVDQIEGALTALALCLRQAIKLAERKVGQAANVLRGLCFWPMEPCHELLEISLQRRHAAP